MVSRSAVPFHHTVCESYKFGRRERNAVISRPLSLSLCVSNMISWHQSDVIHKPSTYMVAGARKWYGGQCDDVRGNHVWWWDPWHRWLMLFLQIDFPWRLLCKDARCAARLSFLCFFPWLISSLSHSMWSGHASLSSLGLQGVVVGGYGFLASHTPL